MNMEAKQMEDSNTHNTVHVFEGVTKMSKFQPIDVKPFFTRKWITNGVDNINFKRYKDAYDDSPTNSSIINAFVNYVYGEGLIDKNGVDLKQYISKKDALLICQDYKMYGGYAVQIIWNELHTKPVRVEYMPIYKLGINIDDNYVVDGYWYSWDWSNKTRFKPVFYPKYTGTYIDNNDLEILYVRRPTAEPYFPIPDYLSGIHWAQVEGELANAGANHFKNAMTALTVVNYNNGRIADKETATKEANRVREKVVGTENQSAVIVSFNEGAEESVTVDQLHPPELNQQNVFYSEEAERKIIVAHSAPPILFSGSNGGNGFSSNADEIAVATKGLYRRHINPMREDILDGLNEVFKKIDSKIDLDFFDFKEETQLENSDVVINNVDDATLQAQAQLKGSVGGVQSLLEVQASYVSGTTTYEAAIAILDLIFGFNREQAIRLLGTPTVKEEEQKTTASE